MKLKLKQISLVMLLITLMVAGNVLAYNEAPMLKKLVATDELPPVEERLPDKPMVVELYDDSQNIGVYGGTWTGGGLGTSDNALLYRTIYYEQLVEWDPEWKKIVPNVAKDWEISDDGSDFTFYLREGIKWSDGHPFTADDLVFWYEDVLLNEDLTTGIPNWLVNSDGTPVKMEKIDDYTIKFDFKEARGLFLMRIATPAHFEVGLLNYPAHYAKQFHIKYANKDKLDKMVKDAGFDYWYELFDIKVGTWDWGFTETYPSLTPWVLKEGYDSSTNRILLERNPYYWKVDTEGNQLPYIDYYQVKMVQDREVFNMMAISGEIDWQDRHLQLNKMPVVLKNQEKGNYHLVHPKGAEANQMAIHININHKEESKNKLFNNAEFRKALSLAIDRQEIIDLLFFGQTQPCQVSPPPGSPYHYEPHYRAYIEYDPDKASEMLDSIGLDKFDSEGYRIGLDGKKLTLVVEAIDNANWVEQLELIKKTWEDVGLRTRIKVEERTLFYERKEAQMHDMAIWNGPGGAGFDPIFSPRCYLPLNHESIFATGYGLWYLSGGVEGIKPPEGSDARKVQKLYDQIMVTPDPGQQKELMQEILKINAENLWVIGICSSPPKYAVVKNYFHNVPETYPSSWMFPHPGPLMPEIMYIKK